MIQKSINLAPENAQYPLSHPIFSYRLLCFAVWLRTSTLLMSSALVCCFWCYFRPVPFSFELQICFTIFILDVLPTYYEDHLTFFLFSAVFIAPHRSAYTFCFLYLNIKHLPFVGLRGLYFVARRVQRGRELVCCELLFTSENCSWYLCKVRQNRDAEI